jgi:hypothetical protein
MGQLTCPNCGRHNVRIVKRHRGFSTHKCLDCVDNTPTGAVQPDGTAVLRRPGGYEFSVQVGASVDPNDDPTVPG